MILKNKIIINGIQQIGIGVKDAKHVFNWYRKNLGFDIIVFEDVAHANLMTSYTDNVIQERYAILAMNIIGGGGLEIWEYRSRSAKPSIDKILLGDLGINTMKIRARDVNSVHALLKAEVPEGLTKIASKNHFFLTDPWDNLVQIVQEDYCFDATKFQSGGVLGAIIGVSDMEAALHFYQNLLGYNLVEDRTGVFDDFSELPGGTNKFRRVLLQSNNKKVGGFGELYGPSEIELLQVLDRKPLKIYKNRLWGDLGFIHLCFDVHGMDTLKEVAKKYGYAFTVDSADSFDMGDAAGRFGYIEDPDGTLIEFVETHKVPILKKLGLFINLKNRDAEKPLAKWLVKAMKIHRVKKDL